MRVSRIRGIAQIEEDILRIQLLFHYSFKIFLNSSFQNHKNYEIQSQLTTPFFSAVNHLSGPLRKQNFTSTGSKGHGL